MSLSETQTINTGLNDFPTGTESGGSGSTPDGIPEWRALMSNSDSSCRDRSKRNRREFCWNHHYRKKNPLSPTTTYRYSDNHYAPKTQAIAIPRNPQSQANDGGECSSPLSSPEAVSQIREPGTTQIRLLRDIDWKTFKPYRAGVIVYTYTTDGLKFCMGVDAGSGEITDFGGGVSYRKDKTAIQAAIREFSEESHDVFGIFKAEQLQNCYAIYNNAMIIILLPLGDLDIYSIREQFQQKVTARSELCDILWISPEEMKSLTEGVRLKSDNGLRSHCFYSRVKNLFSGLYDGMMNFCKLL